MSYCPQCGVENPPAARFCDQCGAALIPVTTPVATPVPASVPVVPTQPPVASTPQRPFTAVAPAGAGVICAQCGASALPGEAFCDNCGAPLSAPTPSANMPSGSAGVSPQPVYPAPQPVQAPVTASTPAAISTPAYTQPVVSARTSLAPARLVLNDGTALPLPPGTQAIIGRADAVSNFTPDVDLSQYGAIEHGVGRRHARVFIQQGQLMIEDLDSTNGSLVNGQKLAPRQPQALADGASIQLGRLHMHVSF